MNTSFAEPNLRSAFSEMQINVAYNTHLLEVTCSLLSELDYGKPQDGTRNQTLDQIHALVNVACERSTALDKELEDLWSIVGTKEPSHATSDADAQLVRLAGELEIRNQHYDEFLKGGGDSESEEGEALLSKLDEVGRKMINLPIGSMEGLRAKVKAFEWCHGNFDNAATTDWKLLAQILNWIDKQ